MSSENANELPEPTTGATPADLLAMAVSGGAEVDKLEKLMDLQERWDAKNARQSFYRAMAQLQSELPEIPHTKTVYARSGDKLYDYAPLSAIVKVVGPIIHGRGFSWRFDTDPQESGGARVSCIVSHKDGHSETTTVTIPPTQGRNTNQSQDHGIVITYGERYAFRAAFGLVSGIEDVDAVTPIERISEEEETVLINLCAEANKNIGKLCLWAGCDSTQNFPKDKYDEACAILKKKIAKDQGAATPEEQHNGVPVEAELQ